MEQEQTKRPNKTPLVIVLVALLIVAAVIVFRGTQGASASASVTQKESGERQLPAESSAQEISAGEEDADAKTALPIPYEDPEIVREAARDINAYDSEHLSELVQSAEQQSVQQAIITTQPEVTQQTPVQQGETQPAPVIADDTADDECITDGLTY